MSQVSDALTRLDKTLGKRAGPNDDAHAGRVAQLHAETAQNTGPSTKPKNHAELLSPEAETEETPADEVEEKAIAKTREAEAATLEAPEDTAEAEDAKPEEVGATDEGEEAEEPVMELAPVGPNHESFGTHDEAVTGTLKALDSYEKAKSFPVQAEARDSLYDAAKAHKGTAREFHALGTHLDGQEDKGGAGRARSVAKAHEKAAAAVEKVLKTSDPKDIAAAREQLASAEEASRALSDKLADTKRATEMIARLDRHLERAFGPSAEAELSETGDSKNPIKLKVTRGGKFVRSSAHPSVAHAMKAAKNVKVKNGSHWAAWDAAHGH